MKKNNSISNNISDISGLYLDIGGRSVYMKRLIGIFDIDNATTEQASVEFLNNCQQSGELENLAADIPVSFIVCDEKVYFSPAAPRTLARTVNKASR